MTSISGKFVIKSERDNVRVIPDAGDVEIVGADKIAKLSAKTSGAGLLRLGINALLSRVVNQTFSLGGNCERSGMAVQRILATL